MASNYEDLEFNQGADVAVELHLVETNGSKKNLANHTIQAMMKRGYDADSSDTLTFNSEITDAVNGIVTLSLTNSQTDSLNPRGKYVYDVELSFFDSDSSQIIERIIEGNVKINPSVTK